MSAEKEVLLTDNEVTRFIVNGFMLLPPEQPAEIHERILHKTAEAFATEGNPGNNVIAKVPEIQQVLQSPRLRGVLKSLVGKRYFVHPYKRCHLSLPSRRAQQIHKDAFWGHRGVRHHRPRWLVVMYYPQDTSIEMGPLSVIPGTQYLDGPGQDTSMSKDFLYLEQKEKFLEDAKTTDIPLPCKAGSVLVFHHHLFHYAMDNNSDHASYMFKFVVCRMDEPIRPTWASDPKFIPSWDSGPCPPGADASLWHKFIPCMTEAYMQVWSWLRTGSTYTVMISRGSFSLSSKTDTDDEAENEVAHGDIDSKKNLVHEKLKCIGIDSLSNLLSIFEEDMHSESAMRRCKSVYICAELGKMAVPVLMKAFLKGSADVQWSAMHGLAAVGSHAAGELADALSHPDEFIRSASAYALGESLCSWHCEKAQFNCAVDQLMKAFSDPAFVVQSCSLSALTHIIQRNLEHVTGERLRQVCDVFLSKLHEYHGDTFVNQGTCLALTRVAPLMVLSNLIEPLMDYFTTALFNSDRYISGYAIEGLKRLDTKESLSQVLQFLTFTHWCPVTNISSLH